MMPTIDTKAVRSLLCVAVIATVLAVLVTGTAYAQITKQWESKYNFTRTLDSYVSYGDSVNVSSTGMVCSVGYSYDTFGSASNADFTTRLIDSSGNQVWVRHHDNNMGQRSRYDYARACTIDSNGNVWVTGYGYGADNDYDCITIAYSPTGTVLVQDVFNGSDSGYDYCRDVTPDSAGNVYVGGYGDMGDYDLFLFKYNASGLVWRRYYDSPGSNIYDYMNDGRMVEIDPAGNVVVAGHANRNVGSYNDYLVVTFTPSGTQLNVGYADGPAGYYDYANGLAVDGSGNRYVSGYGYAYHGTSRYYDYFVAKIGSGGGSPIWTANYHGTNGNSSRDYAYSVATDGNQVYQAGYSQGAGTGYDAVLVAWNANTGAQAWVDRWASRYSDYYYSVAVDANYVYATGYGRHGTGYDFATRVLNPGGGVVQSFLENGTYNSSDYGRAVAVDGNGCVFANGQTSENYGGYPSQNHIATFAYCEDQGCPNLKAAAGGPYSVECASHTTTSVALDGSKSCDPNNGPLNYSWTTDCPGGVITNPTSMTPTLELLGPPPCPVTCTVTLTVSDVTGQTASASAPVTNQDTVSPWQPNLPPDQVVECDQYVAPVAPPAMDICDPDPDEWVAIQTTPGNCAGNYTETHQYWAEDDCGNTDMQVRIMEVEDTTPPIIDGFLTECFWSPNHTRWCVPLDRFPLVVTDNCSPPITCQIVECISDQPDNGTGDGNTVDDCVVGPEGQQVCITIERSGGDYEDVGRTYEIMGTCTDDCGNETAPQHIGDLVIPHDSELHPECFKSTHLEQVYF